MDRSGCALFRKLPYDRLRDIQPVAEIGQARYVGNRYPLMQKSFVLLMTATLLAGLS
jgi:hypothetical protein